MQRNILLTLSLGLALGFLGTADRAAAQCANPSTGPDVIVGDVTQRKTLIIIKVHYTVKLTSLRKQPKEQTTC